MLTGKVGMALRDWTRSHVRVAGFSFTFESEAQQTTDNRHVIVLRRVVRTATIVSVRHLVSAA